MNLKTPIRTVLNKCMKVKKSDSCLIVSDPPKRRIGTQFFQEAQRICKDAVYLEVPPMERNGSEPPAQIAKFWKEFDVVIMPTSKSFSHTKARKAACKAGVRIATMPGITEGMAARALDIDYELMKKRSIKLRTLFDKGKEVHAINALGTNMKMSINGMKGFTDYGIYDKPGRFGNLPAGESGLGPTEHTANGTLVVDACMGTGKLKSPVKITIKDGYAIKFEGRDGRKVRQQFEGLGKEAFHVAEFAIGLNPKAKITGIVLEDEKVLGTAHMALGNNISYGGTKNVAVHIDGVFSKPTIWIDKKKVMEKGTLLI